MLRDPATGSGAAWQGPAGTESGVRGWGWGRVGEGPACAAGTGPTCGGLRGAGPAAATPLGREGCGAPGAERGQALGGRRPLPPHRDPAGAGGEPPRAAENRAGLLRARRAAPGPPRHRPCLPPGARPGLLRARRQRGQHRGGASTYPGRSGALPAFSCFGGACTGRGEDGRASGCRGWAARGDRPPPARPGRGGCAVPQPRVPGCPVLPGPGPRPRWHPEVTCGGAVPCVAVGSPPPCCASRGPWLLPVTVPAWAPAGKDPAGERRRPGEGLAPAVPRPVPLCRTRGPGAGSSRRGLCGTSPCARLLRGRGRRHAGTEAVPASCLVAGGALLSPRLSHSPAAGPEPPVPAARPLAQQQPPRSASAPPRPGARSGHTPWPPGKHKRPSGGAGTGAAPAPCGTAPRAGLRLGSPQRSGDGHSRSAPQQRRALESCSASAAGGEGPFLRAPRGGAGLRPDLPGTVPSLPGPCRGSVRCRAGRQPLAAPTPSHGCGRAAGSVPRWLLSGSRAGLVSRPRAQHTRGVGAREAWAQGWCAAGAACAAAGMPAGGRRRAATSTAWGRRC